MKIFTKTRMAAMAVLFFSKMSFAQTGCGLQLVCKNFLVSSSYLPNYPPFEYSVSVPAIDFVSAVIDSCASSQLVFALRDPDINPGSGFPLDIEGLPQSILAWDCSQLGVNMVEVWVKDPAGNVAICQSVFHLIAEGDFCMEQPAPLVGFVKTLQQWADNSNLGISEATISLTVKLPGFPLSSDYVTYENGDFEFSGLPFLSDTIEITPKKDINPLNGVSTFDLVKMSKHVLNVQPFTSPYQFIAADINKNKQVTTFDIVELRKMILGIYTDFPANDSWRFVSKNYQFTTDTPLQEPFPEKIAFAGLPSLPAENDFIGIKIGDLTGDVIPSNFTEPTDDRSVKTFFFICENKKIRTGEAIEIGFEGSETVDGGQFDLFLKNGKLLEILPQNGLFLENFAQFEAENRLSCSFNETCQPRFSIKFRPARDGELSDFFEIKNNRIRPEAYWETTSERLKIGLLFHEKESGLGGLELFQNQPNPFSEETTIAFNLPKPGVARLSVFGPDGRVLLEKSGEFAAGLQSFLLKKGELGGATGCLFYKIETANAVATSRMMVF